MPRRAVGPGAHGDQIMTATQSTQSTGQQGSSPALQAGMADWWEGMLWPKVLRAPVLGLRPGRLGLAFFFAVAMLLLISVGLGIDARLVEGGAPLPGSDPAQKREELIVWDVFVALPLAWVRGWPITTLIMAPLVIILGTILLGAVSRISAEEFCRGRHMPWTEGLAFSARLWGSSVGAYLGPIVLIWVIALGMAVGGWILLNWPVVNIAGALLYGLFMLGSLAAVIVGVVFIFGHFMLIPAVVCEGSDAIDAIQRAYAYVLARPVRLVVYLLLAAAGVFVSVVILAVIAQWTVGFAGQAAGVWTRAPAWSMIWWGSFKQPPPLAADPSEPVGTYAIGTALIGIWVLVPLLLIVAAFFSTSTAAATVIYLAMRRICDGQDVGELWTPGATEATMAEIMSGRNKAAGGGPQGVKPLVQSDAGEQDDR